MELRDFGRTVDVLFYEGSLESPSVAKPMKIVFERLEPGQAIEGPTLSIPINAGREFLQSLREALDSLGVQPKNESKNEGILEAQTKHLEDMRRLVFNKEK